MSLSHLYVFLEIVLSVTAGALFLVRVVSPEFKGLGWLAGGFAAASLGPGLLLNAPGFHGQDFPALPGLLSIVILLTFALVEAAVAALTDEAGGVPKLSMMLLLIQVLVIDLARRGLIPAESVVLGRNACLMVLSVRTALLTRKVARGMSQVPRWFLLLPLLVVMTLSAAQGVLQVANGTNAELLAESENELRAVHLAALCVLAFGFFWMTTLAHAVRLEESGGTDSLTQLLNRRHFLMRCDQEIEIYQRRGRSFSMMMVDIDHFKSINDTYGHPVGDVVITDVVDRVRDAVRGIDVIGRWGGEEFIVLLKDCPLERAQIAAERLRHNVERMDCSATAIRFGSQRTITVSVGIAEFDGREAIIDLIGRADRGLYKAKHDGRNRVGVAVGEDVSSVEVAEAETISL